jgi:hypothetical protein
LWTNLNELLGILHIETMYAISGRTNLSIAAAAALCCLIPLFDLDRESKYTTDDSTAFQDLTCTLLQRSPSLLACFFVVLIPAADLLLDLPYHISSYLQDEGKCCKKVAAVTVVVRLSDIERLMFMVGVCIQSCVWFLSNSADPAALGIVYGSTTNASIILVLAPILTYLQRCTTTFTSIRASTIVVLAAIGLILDTARNFVRYDAKAYRLFYCIGVTFYGLSGAIFSSYIFLAAFNYSRENYRLIGTRIASLAGQLRATRKRKVLPLDMDNTSFLSDYKDSELYTTYIPALHMAAALAVIIANVYVNFFSGSAVAMAYEKKNYIVILAEIIVLVIELRIRKNEIARGLVRTHFMRMS